MTKYASPLMKPTHIVKQNIPVQVGIAAINPYAVSCDKCGVFHPATMILPTKRGMFTKICYHCGMKAPMLLSEASKRKLDKLKKDLLTHTSEVI